MENQQNKQVSEQNKNQQAPQKKEGQPQQDFVRGTAGGEMPNANAKPQEKAADAAKSFEKEEQRGQKEEKRSTQW